LVTVTFACPLTLAACSTATVAAGSLAAAATLEIASSRPSSAL
jgi:hypothetical protein